jgi:lysophospholipase
MELFSLETNPVPDGATAGAVIAADGTRLRYARWRASGRRTQGTVCVLPGRGESIEKYFETVVELRKRGLAVAVLDWRGQGGSERRLKNPLKAHVDSFAEYDRDLEAFVQQVMLPDCPPPYFALAHGLGGLICLRAAADGQSRFSRAVLVSPLIAFAPGRNMAHSYTVAAFMTAVGLGEIRAPGRVPQAVATVPFEDNLLTGDPGRYALAGEIARQLPQVAGGAPTFGWLFAAHRASRAALNPEFAAAARLPSLVVVGALDRVVSLPAIERLAADLRGGGQIVIPGARHDLLMERDRVREEFFAAFDAFIPGS